MTTTAAHDPTILPAGLPVPEDDGACLHLRGARLPGLSLACTDGRPRRPEDLAPPDRWVVMFVYPRTGVPGQAPSLGYSGEEWDSIPGARGCTPQSCGFRDLHARFQALGAVVYGVSTNTIGHQAEFKSRTRMPFEFLSDESLALTRALDLPTFAFPVESGGPTTLLARMAWVLAPGAGPRRITRVFYPAFPPDRNAGEVLEWLRARAAIAVSPPVNDADRAYVRAELSRHWLSTVIYSAGRRFEADRLPALVARVAGAAVGELTYHADERGLEVVTLSAAPGTRGVGTALMDAAEEACRARGVRRLFLTASNDNLAALRFYQRRGMRIVAVHRGAMDRYRELEKEIPRVGQNGIPLRDELELEIAVED